ncbi:MAG: glycoside hydrolase family 65 protein [Ktedonobacteraceae bacterium]
MDLWHISENTFDPTLKKVHSQETVYSIGNGYFCTRGTFEEGYPQANPATLLYGVFDKVPIAKEELANAPDWTVIRLFVNGERVRLDRGHILAYQRTLDIQNGVVMRTVRWEGTSGARLLITSERFASLADEHVGVIRYSVTAEKADRSLEIELFADLNTAVGNYNLMHWETDDQGHQENIVWLKSQTRATQVYMAQTISITTATQGFNTESYNSDIAPSIRLYGTLAQGATITAEKLVTMYTSRDGVEPLPTALEHHQKLVAAQANVYDSLFTENQAAWQQFWNEADVIIEGDEKAQVGIRYNLYQLRINASSHDDRYSIAAKGLTGFGYRGHIFHDTEIFMLPFFVYTMPNLARNLVMYRYHTLPAARKKAANNGFEGAQYAWESTLSGDEATPSSIIHPETGEIIPVLNGSLELHISASVAHAIWQYWSIAGDNDFMRDYGAEIILSTALFWGSRVEKNTERDDYEINNVIGPDEWHEHVNNNTFTNYMARWNLQIALDILQWLHTTAPAKAQALEQQLDLTSTRVDHWQDVVKRIRILQNPETKVFEQFDGFFKLETLDQSKYKGRTDSYQGILGIHDIQKYRIVKQADVLMLLTVLSQEFDKETKQANWDYYYPLTDHDYGSSLTPAFHVILACELSKANEATELFRLGNLVDIENLRGNTPEGIHTACAGAVWQAAIFGFAGLKVTEEGYTAEPHLPDTWTRLAFNFTLRGKLERIDLHK